MKYQTVAAWSCLLLWTATGQAAPIYTNHLLYNTDPVIHWRLDELSGTVANDAAPSVPYNGTYQNTYTHGVAGPRPADGFVTMNPGNVATGATGNARVRYTELSAAAGANVSASSYSYQMWFNSSVANLTDRTLQYLFTRGNDETDGGRRDAVYIGGGWSGVPAADKGKLRFISNLDTTIGATGTRVLEPNRWYHLAFVRDDTAAGSKARVYLNGKLEIESNIAWQGGSGDQLTAVNRTDSFNSLGLYGSFDEVAVWNRPLGEAEARNLYYDALGSPYLASVLRKDPTAYWRLEETTGTTDAYDFTGNGHSFAYHTTPTRTGTGPDVGPRPAEFGGMPADNNAPTLTGQPLTAGDGYVGIPTGVLTGQNDYSAEMWFRPGIDNNAYGDPWGDYLLHRGTAGGDYLGLTSSGPGTAYKKLYIFNGTAAAYGSTTLATDEWYHVGMTRSGDNVTVYLNGLPEPEISASIAAKGGLTSGQWAFGGRSDMPTQQKFSGNIDEVAVYGTVLDGNSFQENYLSAIVQRDVPYAKTVLSYSPESYWRLDETSPYTLAIDATGHGHTFTYNANASRTGSGNDVGPGGATFVGFGDDNNAPSLAATPVGIVDGVLAGQNDYSAQMWFRAGDSIHSYGHYLLHRGTDKDSGDYLGVEGKGTMQNRLYVFNGTEPRVFGNTPLTKDEWYHVAMTRNGNSVTVYLNGQPDLTTPLAAKTDLTSGQWTFGGRSDVAGMHFTGNVDEVAVYGRSLSKFHVQASYLSALARDECDYSSAVLADAPAAYWRLNEGPEWVAAMDSSGNAHHFEYQASPVRGPSEVGPRPAAAFLGFEGTNTAPTLTGATVGTVTGLLTAQNDYTAEMWFRAGDSVHNYGHYLLHRGTGLQDGDFLGIRSSSLTIPEGERDRLYFYDGGRFDGTTVLEKGQWYHVAMTREDDLVTVYLNGLEEIGVTRTPNSGLISGQWVLGGRSDNAIMHFTGNIDEIAIYAGALSQEDIRAHYLVGVPEPSTWLLLAFASLSLAVRRRRKKTLWSAVA